MQVETEGAKALCTDFVRRAEGFLNRCKAGISLDQQVQERVITKIIKRGFECGRVVNSKNTFTVYIDPKLPIEQKAEILGRAIAETCFYNLTLPLAPQRVDESFEINEFIQEFVRRWIECNSLSRIETWLAENLKD